jgi:ABC-type Fe3+-citrate transport system substrate-binding protein
MDDALEALQAAAENLAAADAERVALMQNRDRLIRVAIEAGATWRKIQDATGLTPRGVSQAINRAE